MNKKTINPTSGIVERLAEALGSPPDLVVRRVTVDGKPIGTLLFLRTVADAQKIESRILTPVFESIRRGLPVPALTDIPVSVLSLDVDFDEALASLLEGQCLWLSDGSEHAVRMDATRMPHRPVEQPDNEPVIRGSHEGFTENIDINVGLIRKRLKSPKLRFHKMTFGRQTNTTVYVVYLDGIANENVIREVMSRLSRVCTDSVLESGYLEEWLQETTLSPFPTIMYTERPDVVTGHLLEGKVAVMTDGTPNALVAPATFFQFFISPEDYYQRADIATLLRWLRFLSFLIGVFVPSLFVAVTTFHQELLPTSLLISLSAQREGVPLPAVAEALLMEIVFELLREAGLRMPRVTGQAISIVGAVVLGQAAVEAGLVSAAIVIVVSLTAIANFIVPIYSFGIAQRMIRFGFMVLAGLWGLFGMFCGTLVLTIHLASLKSFGVAYLTPIAPVRPIDWKDTLVRVPRMWMTRLPQMMKTKRKQRW
jgi:spore germination protein KA